MAQRWLPARAEPWRLIAPSPDLCAHFGPGNAPGDRSLGHGEFNAVVDHHVYQDVGGVWHCWACVRNTTVGRVLAHWSSEQFDASPWSFTGEIIRADRAAGESIDDYHGKEWLQSPFVVRHAGRFWMFYGGHATGRAPDGEPASGDDPRNQCQMCLMTSADGRTWTRHRDAQGRSRIFVGPGEVRDPCLVRIADTWHCYYAGYEPGRRDLPGFYLRTSDDLLRWSDWTCVHRDLGLAGGQWETECPHVVAHEGGYYLFRTEHYYRAATHVLWSDDPTDFGVGDSRGKCVGRVAVAAPEVVVGPDGGQYVTSVHNPPSGVQIARLAWRPAD